MKSAALFCQPLSTLITQKYKMLPSVKSVAIFALVLLLASCGDATKTTETKTSGYRKHFLHPRYALGFTVYENDTEIVFTSRNAHDTTQVYGVLHFEKNTDGSIKNNPYKKLCLTSTTHSFLFDAIDASNLVTGMSAMNYLQDSALVQKYRANKVVNVGKDDQLNRETIVSIQPDGMMVYPYEGGNYSDYEKAGIRVLYNAEYLEENPLGRAEWIKMAGIVANKMEKANEVFNQVEQQYLETKKLVKKDVSAVTVILGKPIDNVWHVPGNNSFAAQMVKDAGAVYGFDAVEGNNVQSKSTEWVLTHGTKAQYWLFTDYSPNDFTLAQLSNENKIYPHLDAVKQGNVIVCNSSKTDFFGKGVIEPHVMLRDMIYHFHGVPENYSPVYFKKIK